MTTTASLQDQLTKLYAARDAILTGAQSYGMGGRSLTRADLKEINLQIEKIEGRLSRRSGTSNARIVFRR